jgi:hypothetical protein
MDWSWQDVLVHVLLYPVYQVLSTARHELAHAIAGRMAGLRIIEVHVLPGRRDGRWRWGYVRWDGTPGIHCHLAPYYAAFASLPFGVWIALDPPAWPLHAWATATVMLLVSPLVDTIYNLLKWRLNGSGDLASAFDRKETP